MFAQAGGIIPAIASLRSFSLARHALTLSEGGLVDRPAFATLAERPGLVEAVVPLPNNRAIPVQFTNGPSQGPQTIIVHLQQDFAGTIDPRAFRTSQNEIIGVVAQDITQDVVMRRVIVQHAR